MLNQGSLDRHILSLRYSRLTIPVVGMEGRPVPPKEPKVKLNQRLFLNALLDIETLDLDLPMDHRLVS